MRRAAAGLVAMVALAAGAPGAQANHVVPTVTATLELGGAAQDDCANPFGWPWPICGGAKRARIGWSASCGPGVPAEAVEEVEVGIMGVPRSGAPFGYDAELLDSAAPLTGSLGMTVGPGLRFFGEVVVKCAVQGPDVDEDGAPVEHRGQATARTAQLYRPPRLAAFRTTSASFCGVNVPPKRSAFLLQAGEYAELEWLMRYEVHSLIRPGVPEVRQIKLFARGAGIRVKASPDRRMLNELGAIGTGVNPRRAGKLRIWGEIGGKRTNTRRVTVLPKRC